MVRLQFQFNGAMMTALFIGMSFTICIGGDDCINYSTTWLGNPPVSFIFTSLQVCLDALTLPLLPPPQDTCVMQSAFFAPPGAANPTARSPRSAP